MLLQTILTRITKEQLVANYMYIIKPLSYSCFKFKLLTFSLLKISSLLVSMIPIILVLYVPQQILSPSLLASLKCL